MTHLVVATLAFSLLLVPARTASAQDTTGVGVISGTVVTMGGAPAPEVAVCVPVVSRCAVTDAAGRFNISDLRAGTYDIEIVAPPSPTLTSRVEVRAGRDAVVAVTLPGAAATQETVTVTAPRFVAPEELNTSAFLIAPVEIAQSAGALQDVSRYLQALPGVVIGTDDFRNDLIVRGGSSLENLYIVDNVEIPNINTFANFSSAGGTVSTIDADLLRDVTFLTGGYPAPYGNRTSSVLQLALREGRPDRIGARATIGFAGAGGVLEGPIKGGRGSWIASARRSFLDLFTDDVGIGGVPVLYTFNGKATYDVTPRDRVWAVNISAIDRVRLGLTDDSDPTEELSNLDIRYRGRRSATGVNWQRTFGRRGVGLFGVSYGRASVDSTVADLLRGGAAPGTAVDEQLARAVTVFSENSSEQEMTVKYDLTTYMPMLGKVQSGISVKRTTVDYGVSAPFGSNNPYFAEPDQNPFTREIGDASYLTGVYLQNTRSAGERASITTGVRVDRFGLLAATRVQPRLGATYRLTRTTSLRGAVGRYYQQPFALFVAAFPENAALVPFRADHAVAGLTWVPSDRARVSVETYYKRYRDYPVSTQVPSLSLASLGDTFDVRQVLFPLQSAGTGTVRGVEFQLEQRPVESSRWHGHVNLAISRARYSGKDGVLRPASFDYPVVANATGGWRLTDRWTLSTRLAFLSGRPNTPLDIAASTAGRRAIFDTARVNAERLDAYFRMDVRVDRLITVGGRQVRVFAGANNVTNRLNVAGFSWDRRSNLPRQQDQQGLFPILGLDWQF